MSNSQTSMTGLDVSDRREPTTHALRVAILRLRLAEFRAAEYLPTQDMCELTDAVDQVVAAVRTLL